MLEFYENIPNIPNKEDLERIRKGGVTNCRALYKALNKVNTINNNNSGNSDGELFFIDDYAVDDMNKVLPNCSSVYINLSGVETSRYKNNKEALLKEVRNLLKKENTSVSTAFWKRFREILLKDSQFSISNCSVGDLYFCFNITKDCSGLQFSPQDVIRISKEEDGDNHIWFNKSNNYIKSWDLFKAFKKMRPCKNKEYATGKFVQVAKDFAHENFAYKKGEVFRIVPKISSNTNSAWGRRFPHSAVNMTCKNRLLTAEMLEDTKMFRISNGFCLSTQLLDDKFNEIEAYNNFEEVYEMNLKRYKKEKRKRRRGILQLQKSHGLKAQDFEVDTLIEAGYPLINILSYEEQRVINAIRCMTELRSRRMIVWSVTTGFDIKITGKESKILDPLDALKYILNLNSRGRTVFILKDYHKYLGQYADSQVIRMLRDIAEQHNKIVIILSPIQDIPVELKKDVAIINYDLPGVKALEQLMHLTRKQIRKVKRIKLKKKDVRNLAKSALGLTVNEAKKIFTKILMSNATSKMEEGAEAKIFEEKIKIIKASGLLEHFKTDVTFNDIGGLEILKDWLNKRGKDLTPIARKYGLPYPKGILLVGIPGCGKTMICKAIGNLWNMPVLRLDVGRVFGGIVGQSEANMREVISTVEALKPCILFIDEVEKGFSGIGSSNFSDAGTTAKVFGTFLSWMQDKKDSFLICTANDVEQLPVEFLRKGRFDETFFVDLPDLVERKKIFEIHIKRMGRKIKDHYKINELAAITKGYTGAEIEQIIIEAMHEAFHDDVREFNGKDLLEAVKNVTPLFRSMHEKVVALRKWKDGRARLASLRKEEVVQH